MDYGNILRRSWDVIWNHKFMLVLGFLAALGSGGSGFGNNSNYSFDGREFESVPELSENVAAVIAAAGVLVAGLICFLIILGIVLWLVRLTAQAGMIDAAYRLDAGEKVTFGEALSAGWHKLGRMIGLNIILFGVFFLIAIVGVAVLVFGIGATAAGAAAGAAGGGDDVAALIGGLGMGILALVCCLMCVFLLVAIVVNVLYPFAQRAAILEDMGVIASIGRGWQVIRENLAEVIILLLLFLMLGFLVGMVTIAVFLPLIALSIAPIVIRMFSGGTLEVLDVALASGGLLCMIFFGAAINAIYVAFRSTVFTLAYGEFTGKKPITVVSE